MSRVWGIKCHRCKDVVSEATSMLDRPSKPYAPRVMVCYPCHDRIMAYRAKRKAKGAKN